MNDFRYKFSVLVLYVSDDALSIGAGRHTIRLGRPVHRYEMDRCRLPFMSWHTTVALTATMQ